MLVKMEQVIDLYQKLNEIHPKVHSGLVAALSGPFVPPGRYFAGTGVLGKNYSGMATDITDYLTRRGVEVSDDFRDNLFFSFLAKHEEPQKAKPVKLALLDIEYGRIWADKIPDELFQAFNEANNQDRDMAGWIVVYFLPGIWMGKSSKYMGNRLTKTKLLAWRTPQIVGKIMEMGIGKLNKYQKPLKKKLPRRSDIEAIAGYLANPHRDQLIFDLVQNA